ncbi:hypothetical protein TIFTF001_017390 [Ficus carica]|uniref:Uncharacterized protein n=1 Tax=Ficus carica TaxID=3494 RepID=A0AA88A9G3_FICCA|nr:hypothetical protein TIFTF001_017390 [Ficus carica]
MPKPLVLFFWFKQRFQEVYPIPVEALTKCYTIFLISLNCKPIRNGEVAFAPSIEIQGSHEWPLSPMGNPHIRQIEKLLFIKNQVIPEKPEEDVPWERLPTKCTQQIKRILDEDNTGTSSGSSTSSRPSTIPSSTSGSGSTPKPAESEESKPARFQSEGPSFEKEFRFIQWAQDPYDQEPIDPEELRKLGISSSSTQEQPQVAQSYTFKYNVSTETHSSPQPCSHRICHSEWYTDKFWEDEQNRQEILQLIDEIEDIEATERA